MSSTPQQFNRSRSVAAVHTAGAIPRLRVGVLLDGPNSPLWVHKTIEEILHTEHLELKAIIANSDHEESSLASPRVLFRLWNWTDRRLCRPDVDAFGSPRHEYPIDIISVQTAKHGGAEVVFSESDLMKIRTSKLDVILHLGAGEVPPQVLNCARYGVWTFQSTKGGRSDGDFSQFWELYDGKDVSVLTLCALQGGKKRDLYRSTVSNDTLSLQRNRNATCWRKSQIFLRLLADLHYKGWAGLQRSNTLPDTAIDEPRNRRAPGNGAMARFLARWSVKAARRKLSNLVFPEQWMIAYYDKRPSPNGTSDIKIIQPPTRWHYCDPFLFEHGGRHYIFFEVWNQSSKGEIWFVEIDQHGEVSQPERALGREYHLSYPFLFQWENEIYMLPETSQNRSVEIYRAIDFPRRWELAKVLLKNVVAVDSTILERDGKLWLFTAGIGGPDLKSSELSLFFADSPFGEWTPHPKNPIVCDVRRARPAGSLFYEMGQLIRPAQDCSESYGHAISLNRVEVLSETDYRETLVAQILPNWAPWISATHTLNVNSTYEVLDAKSPIVRYGLVGCTPGLKWPERHRLDERSGSLSGRLSRTVDVIRPNR